MYVIIFDSTSICCCLSQEHFWYMYTKRRGHNMFGERLVCLCQSGTHPWDIVPFFFCILFKDNTYHSIMFAVHFMNSFVTTQKNFKHSGQNATIDDDSFTRHTSTSYQYVVKHIFIFYYNVLIWNELKSHMTILFITRK